jgi:hypothetical protein
MESYSINSYSTFKSEFNATCLQADAMMLSDVFELSIDFAWLTPDIAKGNAAFLKMKYFVEDVLHQSIFTHKNAQINLKNISNKIVMFPYVPTNDIIAMTLHSKLNAIVGEDLDVLTFTIASKSRNPIMSYTYADVEYPALPELKEWVGFDKYWFMSPWWGRADGDTEDYEINENSDLTSPPERDTIMDEIEKVVMGELELQSEGGEVVDISDWKPQII